MSNRIDLLLFLLGLTLIFTSTQAQTVTESRKDDFKVIGYYTPRSAEPESLPLDYLTHINYSFSIPAPSGDTLLPLRDDSILERLVKHAHRSGKFGYSKEKNSE